MLMGLGGGGSGGLRRSRAIGVAPRLASEIKCARTVASGRTASPAAQDAQHETTFAPQLGILQPRHGIAIDVGCRKVAGSIHTTEVSIWRLLGMSVFARAGSINATAIKNNGSRRAVPRIGAA
jgi:hypothetical protein